MHFSGFLALAAAAAAAIPLLTGGTAATERASLAAEHGQYAPGDSVRLRLVNESADTLGYNLCHSRVERRSAEEWILVRRLLRDGCRDVLLSLAPGDSVRYAFLLPASAAAGDYRVVTAVVGMGDGSGSELEAEFAVRR